MKKMEKIIRNFDKQTGLVMEMEQFRSCHIRDVNNFINITKDGGVKRKGAYAKPNIQKNPFTPIVNDAVAEYLLNGTPVEKTIRECKEMFMFCSVIRVTGGAVYHPSPPPLYPIGWEEQKASKRGLTQAIKKRRDKMIGKWVQKHGYMVGKVVRFYYAKDGQPMYYKKSGNKVPNSDGCKPMMQLSKIAEDISYNKYVYMAESILKNDLGVTI